MHETLWRRRIPAAHPLFIFAGYFGWAILFTWPLASDIGHSIPMPGYLADTPQVHNLWTYLWWLWQISDSLFGRLQVPVHTDWIFYPLGLDVLPYFIQCLVPTLVFATLESVFQWVSAANLLLLLALSFAATGCYLLACELFGNRLSAYLAGLAFAFGCPQLANTQGHLLVVASIPLIPVYLLALVRTCRHHHGPDRMLLAAATIGLFFSYWYYFLFTALFTLVYFVTAPVTGHGLGRFLKAMIAPAFVIIPVAALVILRSSGRFAEPLSVSSQWSVDLLAFFLPTPDHSLWAGWSLPVRRLFGANPTIQSAYLSYPLLALTAVAMVTQPLRKLRPWLAGFILFSVLALGPVLHVAGHDGFQWFGRTVSVPLPFVWLHRLPVFDAIRDCSMFLVISSLCLAILAGYGAAALLDRFKPGALIFGCLLIVLVTDSMMFPYPLQPVGNLEIYRELGRRRKTGTTIEVPLRNDIRTYEFHQIYHRQRRLLGNLSRMDPVYATYGDDLPLIGWFKNPARLPATQGGAQPPAPSDIAWLLNFFDLKTVIVENRFLSAEQQRAVTDFLAAYFPVKQQFGSEDGTVTVFELKNPAYRPDNPIRIDFGAPPPHYYVKKGWYGPERWSNDLDMCWSEGAESELIVWLPEKTAYTGELRVRPFCFPGAAPQSLQLFVNDRPLKQWTFSKDQWSRIRFPVPAGLVQKGLNRFRFRYGYNARPSEVFPNNRDSRRVALAYDYFKLTAADRGADSRGDLRTRKRAQP